MAELFLLTLHITFFFELLIVFITFSSFSYPTFSGSQHIYYSHLHLPLLPCPSDFVTCISIRYQNFTDFSYILKQYRTTKKHAEKIKPFRSHTQSLNVLPLCYSVLKQTNETHTLLQTQNTKGYRNKSSNYKEAINISWNA